jgi:hypothetical protein
MSVEAQIESLQEQHKSLEALILKEEEHTPPDELRISELKKEKLRLKDRITQLEHVA